MPDGPHGVFRRRRHVERALIILATLVLFVDVAAVVLTIISDSGHNRAQTQLTDGLAYLSSMSLLVQYTLDAETGERGYLITHQQRDLQTANAALRGTTGVLAKLSRESFGDPLLQRDYAQLASLVGARDREVATVIALAERGENIRAIRLIRLDSGSRVTQQVRALAGHMRGRVERMIVAARRNSQSDEAWAERASVAAYLSSAAMLVVMLTLFRNYMLVDAARRRSRVAQLEAERLNAAKSGFLSRVSHELRTPLNAILGFGQLLERDLVDKEERESLTQMLLAGRHLLAMVDDLLDLSRIEAGELRLSLEPVVLTEVLSEGRALIAPTAASTLVGVRYSPVPTDLRVVADRARLLQVLLNLLSNAVKYNRPGGSVVLSASATNRHTARIEVADTGIGIAPGALTRLFTPFERLDADSRGIEGTGLGLALARGLMEAMAGTLDVSSREGVGTTIAVELPLAAQAAAVGLPEDPSALPEVLAPPSQVVELNPAGRGERVTTTALYIEDNPSNVRLVQRIFDLAGDLQLDVATSGAAGLALARGTRPDLILLDLHLPDMGGERVLETLQGDPELRSTPVIIVSADASATQARRLRDAGASGYLTKPFDINQLLAAVRMRGAAEPAVDQSAERSLKMLDPAMVSSLHALAANPAVGHRQIGEMLLTFRRDAGETLRSLQTAVTELNLSAIQHDAHRLAGGAGAVAASLLYARSKDLERQAKQGDFAAVQSLGAMLEALLEQTWEALAEEFAEALEQVPLTGRDARGH